MEGESEKVYVAVGKNTQEGLATLEWVLKNWSSQSVSVVILHVNCGLKDFVSTPFGKLPASSVSDEKLEAWKMDEKTKTEKLLAKYLSLCGGKVKAEVLNLENFEEPVHVVIVKLISTLHIKKLVIGMTFKKSPSWKSKTAISSAIYIQKHKPSFCELFITCRGKLVLVRAGNEQGEYEEGEMAADLRRKMKEKGSFRGWLGRLLLPDTPICNRDRLSQAPSSSSSSSSLEKSDSWDSNFEQIEAYFQWLSNSVEEIEEDGDGSRSSQLDQTEEEAINSDMSTPERIEALKAKIEDYKKIAQEKINEAKDNVERRQRAEWALSLCDKRIGKLVALVEEEVAKQIDLNRDLDMVIEQLEEVTNDIETSKNRLKSALELEGDLRNVLHLNSTDKLRIEAQLEKALAARAETLREIEEMRRERDVFRRRNELCGESEALSFRRFREFTAEELKEATDDFSERMRIKTGANGFLYRGRIHQTDVAIKLHNPLNKFSCHEFQAKMKVLSSIRHPHLVTILGACTELKSVVYEYVPHGSLQDVLFPKPNKKKNSRKKQPPHLSWPARLRILAETASAVGFLHSTRPAATAHRHLGPSNVLLDRNLVAKVADFATDPADPSDLASDIRDLGVLTLQMLRGEEEEVPGKGVWDVEVGRTELERIAEGCVKGEVLKMEDVVREMDELGRKLGEERVKIVNGGEHRHDVPGVFLCPITQEVMKDPHVAGDGFSYELEAIQEWLKSGHDTSPMTNLKLKNKILTPNHTLRSLIQDWNCRFTL